MNCLCLQVWCLAVSSLGDMVVTGSGDRSIRVWERTDEPFFAEEEKENRLDSLFEADQPVSLPRPANFPPNTLLASSTKARLTGSL